MLWCLEYAENIYFLFFFLQGISQQQYVSQKREMMELNNKMAALRSEIASLKAFVMNECQDVKKEMEDYINLQNKSQPGDKIAAKTTNKNDSDSVSHRNETSNNVTNTAKGLSELDLRLQLHENTKYDGTVVWKIDNFNMRRKQALTGEVTALHSAPCYTSRYGYKFCARLYLNGDGAGRNTHASLFIVLMRSEYDNVIEWPFNKMVTMTLINQRSQKMNVMQKMMPNKDSPGFQKPKKNVNIAVGCPMFVRIDRLMKEGFVMNNSLYLTMEVTR